MRMLFENGEANLFRAFSSFLEESCSKVFVHSRPCIRLEGYRKHAWASLTFTGHRHGLEFALTAPDSVVDALLSALRGQVAEPSLMLKGAFLADLELHILEDVRSPDAQRRLSVLLEALTIDE